METLHWEKGEPYVAEFESLKDVLLELARERSLDSLFHKLIESNMARPHVAHFGIWLVDHQPDGTPFLKLEASGGRTATGLADWRHKDGDYRTVPFDEPIIGAAAAERHDVHSFLEDGWDRPDWAEKEGILAVGSTPIIHQDELLGVLAAFIDRPIYEQIRTDGQTWRRIFTDQLASTIVNVRAFEEIDHLRSQLELENEYLREEVKIARKFGQIVGSSRALARVLDQVELVAPTEASVLILGESGTGKELIAQAIHENSTRQKKPLIRVNCPSVPRELFESEFFGHIRGAFTGAVKDREGRFQLANGGTLFLDEIAEIPFELQSKLLRVLQEGTLERIGEDRTRKVDVRIIAATNRDLKKEVEAGRFREDLFFRLSVFPIEVPALKDRLEDIPDLTRHFIADTSRRLGLPQPTLKQRHILQLQSYSWPGNVRELQNVIERAVILARGETLTFDFLPDIGLPKRVPVQPVEVASDEVVTEEEWNNRQRDNIRHALELSDWKIQGRDGAAELLGIKPTTLRSRMKALGIEKG
ncbi:sigma 54-interacting transcriptional regulator [bacterium]|nr:sigma 54-interacting transcriptional regulator [bacterium]